MSARSSAVTFNPLQLGEDGIGTGDGDLAGVGLVLSVRDLAVVEHHSPAAAVYS
jgi:hypothetical protein